MPKFVTNVEPFWQQELKDHTYARTVDWSAKNFDHLNKEDYNTGHLISTNPSLSIKPSGEHVI